MYKVFSQRQACTPSLVELDPEEHGEIVDARKLFDD